MSRILSSVESVRQTLIDHPEFFEVTLYEVGAPATRAALDEAESRIGVRLPEALRQLYAEANGVRFEWTAHAERCLAAGYREARTPTASFLH